MRIKGNELVGKVEGIKEQQNQIDELKNGILEARQQMVELKKMIEKFLK